MSRRDHEEDYDEYYDDEYEDDYDRRPRRARRRTGCWLLIVVLAVLATCGGGVLALVLYMAGEPNEIAVDIQPKTVALTRGDDEPLSIEIEIENKSVDAVIISALGLDSKLMDNLEVVDLFVAGNSELRKPKERNYPVYGNWTEYKIDQTIPEKKKLYLTLQIKARPDAEFGTYSGDLTIWVEDQVLGVSLSRATRSTITITVAAGQAG